MAIDLFPVRLTPGQDLRQGLEAAVAAQGCSAAYVVSGIGSLSDAQLRLAGAAQPVRLPGDTELLTLAGSVSADGAHLHATLADAQGAVIGGHVPYGCAVRTTAEVLLALIREWRFARQFDARTGYDELAISPVDLADAAAAVRVRSDGEDGLRDDGDEDD